MRAWLSMIVLSGTALAAPTKSSTTPAETDVPKDAKTVAAAETDVTAEGKMVAAAETQKDQIEKLVESAAPSEAVRQDDEKVGLLQGQLESLTESFLEVKGDASILKKLKFSGYIQGRYQYNDTSRQGLTAAGKPAINDGFSIRRGRLKAEYTGTMAGFQLQIDATPTGFALKDAEARLVEPWTSQKIMLVVGQTKWPFGYEVVQSSGDREFPERTRVVRAFANGERDRGAKLMGSFGPARVAVGVFDGNGTGNTPYPGVDNDKNKDVVGRAGVDFGFVTGGVSAWYGQSWRAPDATGAGAGTFERSRFGADVQVYLDLVPFGATSIKGEYMFGKTYQVSGLEQYGVPASGWYGLIVQNIGLSDAVAVRYDYFDPFSGVRTTSDAADPTKPRSTNGIGTVGLMATHYMDETLKISAVYEMPMTDGIAGVIDPRDNLFTIQLQAKF